MLFQVRSICDHVRPDRQCQLYSATFKKRIEKLARDVLSDPIRVAQGDLGSASELVTQVRNKMGFALELELNNTFIPLPRL